MKDENTVRALAERAENEQDEDTTYTYELTVEGSSVDYWCGVEEALRWVLSEIDPAAFRD